MNVFKNKCIKFICMHIMYIDCNGYVILQRTNMSINFKEILIVHYKYAKIFLSVNFS